MVSRASQPCERPRFHSIYSRRASVEPRHSQRWSRYPSPCRDSEVEHHSCTHRLNGNWEAFIPGPLCLMSVGVQGTWQWPRLHNCFQQPTPALNYLCRRNCVIYSRGTEIRQSKTYFPHLLGIGHFATPCVLEYFGHLKSWPTPPLFLEREILILPALFIFLLFHRIKLLLWNISYKYVFLNFKLILICMTMHQLLLIFSD